MSIRGFDSLRGISATKNHDIECFSKKDIGVSSAKIWDSARPNATRLSFFSDENIDLANEHMDTSNAHGDAPRPTGDRGGRVEDAAARTAKPHGNCDELYVFFMG